MKNLQIALAEIIANLEIEFNEFRWTCTMQAADKRPVFHALGEAGVRLAKVFTDMPLLAVAGQITSLGR